MRSVMRWRRAGLGAASRRSGGSLITTTSRVEKPRSPASESGLTDRHNGFLLESWIVSQQVV